MNSSGSERRYYCRFVFFFNFTADLLFIRFNWRNGGRFLRATDRVESIIPSTRGRVMFERREYAHDCRRTCFPVLSCYRTRNVHVAGDCRTSDDYNGNTYTRAYELKC